MCGSLNILWHCLSLGLDKIWFFSTLIHCWGFQICWHIDCSTLTASSLRILNSSGGIPSPPLAFFIEMLPKAHLTSQSTMSSSWWVISPSWLSGSLTRFLFCLFVCLFCRVSVYSCHLFLNFSVSVKSILFCPVLCHLCVKCFLYISNFFEEITSLSHSFFFLNFFSLFI